MRLNPPRSSPLLKQSDLRNKESPLKQKKWRVLPAEKQVSSIFEIFKRSLEISDIWEVKRLIEKDSKLKGE